MLPSVVLTDAFQLSTHPMLNCHITFSIKHCERLPAQPVWKKRSPNLQSFKPPPHPSSLPPCQQSLLRNPQHLPHFWALLFLGWFTFEVNLDCGFQLWEQLARDEMSNCENSLQHWKIIVIIFVHIYKTFW